MSLHYEVQSRPDPKTRGESGIYDVVRMDRDTVLKVIRTFYGSDRHEAYQLVSALTQELAEWRSEQQHGAIELIQQTTPAEFKCLCLARDLPHEGVHAGAKRGPGGTEIAVLMTLEKRGLLDRHPDKPLHWQLSIRGKLLMGNGEDNR